MVKQLKPKIGVIGLGYVGLPVALEFAKEKYQVIGFDISVDRIKDLNHGIDLNFEEDISGVKCTFTDDFSLLSGCNIYIICVPTPISKHRTPDLAPLIEATKIVGRLLKEDDIVVYESTVYPGVTEDVCIPILEDLSTLTLNADFGVGYSPERINPGDRVHRLPDVVKVVSGSNDDTLERLTDLYSSIIAAGVFSAKSIKVAEAAKVLENTQRDINIALMNEMSELFYELDIKSKDVLDAASTKWNFLPFEPGLVGGHCIGVDPYYLVHKANEIGFNSEMILAGRRVNENYPKFIAKIVAENIFKKIILHREPRVLLCGLTFKQDCSDFRNSKSFDLIDELSRFNFDLFVNDPYLTSEAPHKVSVVNWAGDGLEETYDAVIFAVAHSCYKDLTSEFIRTLASGNESLVFDLKNLFPDEEKYVRF